jgi:dUTP pyrophosphatase
VQIRIQRIHPEAMLPSYAHGPTEDAGMDLPGHAREVDAADPDASAGREL